MIDRDEFFAGYLDAILFTEPIGGTGEEHFDDTSLLSHGCDRDDFAPDALTGLRKDCEDFIDAEEADIEAYCEQLGAWRNPNADSFGRTYYAPAERAGTDFWLSRNGHGSGFFDRGNEPVFARLQAAARIYGAINIYFDGERIYTD
jgi:hypothetical protein